jgi:hypothetical protein
MKMTGLKGVTDAMGHCKSMYAKGGSANKNQIIRSMKSYQMGGNTEGCVDGPGRPKCGKSKTIRSRGKATKSFGRSFPGMG